MRIILNVDEASLNTLMCFIEVFGLSVEVTRSVSGYDRDSETNANIRRNIRRLREERGLTRPQLSKMSDVRETLIYFVETGKRILNDWELRCIADALSCTVEYLAAEHGVPDMTEKEAYICE